MNNIIDVFMSTRKDDESFAIKIDFKCPKFFKPQFKKYVGLLKESYQSYFDINAHPYDGFDWGIGSDKNSCIFTVIFYIPLKEYEFREYAFKDRIKKQTKSIIQIVSDKYPKIGVNRFNSSF